jgi:fumarylacetoacetate (FAA) hydrolase family protein
VVCATFASCWRERDQIADPEEQVAAMMGAHHQYPDGAVLFLGTLFAPIQDRGAPGKGFTHEIGDVVTIRARQLSALMNRMKWSTECEPWTFGAGHLMRNLAQRGVL